MAIPSPQVISAVDTVSDQRLDIDGTVWQLSTNTNESVILYGITDNAGTSYEIGYFKERPAALNFYGSNAAPAVSGETEVTTLGAIASNKFYVDYDRAFILFPDGHSTPVNVTYKGMGSIQKAIDVNESIKNANSAILSESWASKDDGAVSGSDFSSKANASVVGANAPAEGSAKEWASLDTAIVADSKYSAKEYASGVAASTGGSSKSWSQDTDGVNGAGANDRSAKAWSQGASMTGGTLGGSSKDWAQTVGGTVNGSEYSAKEYALGTTVAVGSAKDWAILPEDSVVDGGSGYSALHWAAKAATTYDSFDDRYLGAKGSAPSVDNDNQTLLAGALYFNSSESAMYVRTNSSTWVLGTPVAPLSMIAYKYVATANQTSFSGADESNATLSYTADNINVYLNGVRLDATDYTATNGTAVVLDDGALVNDELVVIAFKAFTTSSFVGATGGTFSGGITFGGGLTVGGAWTAASQTCANLGTVTTTGTIGLGGKLTAGSNEIEGSNFDINGGTIDGCTITGALGGNATTATALAAGRTIGMTGDVVWTSPSFDGSGNVTATATIQANSVTMGTDTTGNYVATVTAGTGLTSTGATSGESIAHSLSVDPAQTQITSVGTLTSLTGGTGDFNWDSNTLVVDQSAHKVGIGIAAPLAPLEITSDAAGTSQPNGINGSASDTHTGLFLTSTGNTVNEKYGMQFGGWNSYSMGGIFGVLTSASNSTAGDLTFDMRKANSDTALTEVMRITSVGKVGIGTGASPDAPLEISNSYDGFDADAHLKLTNPNDGSNCPHVGTMYQSSSVNGAGKAWFGVDHYISEGRGRFVWMLENTTSTSAVVATSDEVMSLDRDGELEVQGNLIKGSGSFKIDHPLPSMKDTHKLVHSFTESPRADLIYRGTVALVDGSATIDLDTEIGMTSGTWILLCRDEQVFTSNETGWNHVRGLVSGSTLSIECEETNCTDTISWMVVAERHDQHMYDTKWTDENGKPILEPEKTEREIQRQK